MSSLILVFVHGYSVTNLDTYGELPLRLRNEANARGMDVQVENIYLGRYITFNDEVRLDDISRAMEAAVQQQIPKNGRFICITHSTGGPVVRNWWHLFYQNQADSLCPMSHLIMLAPANYGSALAQLGKTRISLVKSWFEGVEPGQRILDWLELGSDDAWELNKDWILEGALHISPQGIFPFVLSGQDIDRKLYDHINAYTGELGSDGVVRVASANLNSHYIVLKQQAPLLVNGNLSAPSFETPQIFEAPQTALRILTKKSHSGDTMGIMKSVSKDLSDTKSVETVNAIFDCINVKSTDDYAALCNSFIDQTTQVQKNGQVEIENKFLNKAIYIHDRFCMIIFRVKDSEGYPLTNFDLILTGPGNSPDNLASGFFADRQGNKVNQSAITYFLNYDIMNGCDAIIQDGEVIRKALPGMDNLGLIIKPRPDEGFIRYLPCEIEASKILFEKAIKPNSTVLVDIVLKRVVSTEVFRFEKIEEDQSLPKSFKDISPGNDILG
jgi:hypothetical protein